MGHIVLKAAVAIAALASVSAARAASCEQTFVKKGSSVTGLRFVATATVPDATPAIVLGQLRGIAASSGYDIIIDEADYGSLLIEQPMTGTVRAFPIEIKATAAGAASTIVMEAKLRGLQIVKESDARQELCGMLSRVLGGRVGIAAAANGKGAVNASGPVAMSVLMFSHTVAKDTEKNAAGVLLRYKDKQYTLDGIADYITRDDGAFRVGYRILDPWRQPVRLPGAARFKIDVVCYMAKGQATYTLQLKPGANIKLTGTVVNFDEYKKVIWLQDCRNAK